MSVSHMKYFFFCPVPGYPGGLLAVLVGVPLFFFFFLLQEGILLLGYFSSFSIILFAVDLSFPIFVSKMSVVVTYNHHVLAS